MHLGCRSGAAAEGWSSRSRRGSVGALGVALSELLGRERRASGSEGKGVAGFPPLTVNIRGYRNTIPASSSVSFQFISAASKAPFSPPPKKKTQPVSLCVSLPLSDGVLLPCIQGLGSLSLPFPPPPLPACDPTLRPHPSSLCQSGAAQPCRGAELPATHWLQAGRQAGRAGKEERSRSRTAH